MADQLTATLQGQSLERGGISADLAYARLPERSGGTPFEVYPDDAARRSSAQSGPSGVDSRLYLLPEPVSVLNEVARRSCGGIVGQ